jgi:peptide/nickel transport system permease protein
VKLTALWTDWVLFLFVAGGIGYARHVARHPYLIVPWRQVRHRSSAMVSFVVLAFYVGIGLLDSIHFRERLPDVGKGGEVYYSPEVISLFDRLTTPLRKGVERTYSAPLSAHLHVKENREQTGGVTTREHPRLTHGGAHLTDPETDRLPDLFFILLKWGAIGLLMAALFWGAISRFAGRLWRPRDPALRAALTTASLLIVFCALAWGISLKYHLLGTDKVGQDVFYLSLKSIRTGLVIGVLTTWITLPFAIGFGIAAGYFGGWIDDAIQYLYTTLNSIPGVLLIAASVLTLQAYMDRHEAGFAGVSERSDVRLLMVCLILGATGWIGLCRLLRGEALKLREIEYVQAAEAIGVGYGKILFRHILPNVMPLVLIAAVLDFSGIVLAEAVLSYVGIGVDPAMISWGNMINGARMEMAREPIIWWSLFSAFVLMFGLVLAANLFSDAVRDAFDPRLRGR